MVARVLNDGTTYRLGQRLAVPDATLMAVGVMLEGEAVKLGKPTPVFKLPADAGGWVPAGRPFRTSRRGRGAACDESAVSASDGLMANRQHPSRFSPIHWRALAFLSQHSQPRKDRVVEIVRLRLSLEIARVAWISNHFQIREMLRSIRHTIRGSGPSVQRTAELAMAVEQRKETKE